VHVAHGVPRCQHIPPAQAASGTQLAQHHHAMTEHPLRGCGGGAAHGEEGLDVVYLDLALCRPACHHCAIVHPPPNGRRNAINVVHIYPCKDVCGSRGRFFTLQTTALVSTSRSHRPLSHRPTASANKLPFAERPVLTSTLILPPLVCVSIVGETLPREEEEEEEEEEVGGGKALCRAATDSLSESIIVMPLTELHVARIGLPHVLPSPGQEDTMAIGRTWRHAHQPGVSVAPPLLLLPLLSPPPPAHHQVLHDANSGRICGRDASLPVVILLPSRIGAAPGLDDAVRLQGRKVRTGGGGRRSIPAAVDGQEGQRDQPPRPSGNAVAFSSRADTWMMDSLSGLLLSWTTTSASKCRKPFSGTIEGTVTFLGRGGTIQGPAKGFCCTREGSFARVTLGQFAAASFASLFSWTFIEADLWRPKQRGREETASAPQSLSPF
jgi:hypothetical protein